MLKCDINNLWQYCYNHFSEPVRPTRTSEDLYGELLELEDMPRDKKRAARFRDLLFCWLDATNSCRRAELHNLTVDRVKEGLASETSQLVQERLQDGTMGDHVCIQGFKILVSWFAVYFLDIHSCAAYTLYFPNVGFLTICKHFFIRKN